MIRVLLADDQKLVREGWCVLLDHSSDISIVGQARDGQEAVELAPQLAPDVILMDVNMPRLDGLEATRRIVAQQPGVKVLMVTQSLDESSVRTALQQGAWGYVSKNDMFSELLPAVLSLQSGQSYFSKTIREQYPHVVDEPSPRVSTDRHKWQHPAWTSLDHRLQSAMVEAVTRTERARSVCQQSRSLCTRSRESKAFTLRLLRLRHPSAPVTT